MFMVRYRPMSQLDIGHFQSTGQVGLVITKALTDNLHIGNYYELARNATAM